jgi:hypothetical protein
MSKCRRCGEPLPLKKENWPARCPKCRDPLFERAGGPQLLAESQDTRRGVCSVHTSNVAIGTCPECGQRYCAVCRTRWRDQTRCVTCVERQLADQETMSPAERVQRRQAVLGLSLGVVAWLLVVLGLLNLPHEPGSPSAENFLVLAVLLVLLPAIAGLGQAITALLGSGQRRWLSLSGLLLNGLHLGLFVGLLVLRIGKM